MNIWSGYVSIGITFVILASIFLWSFIKTSKANLGFKLLIIPVLIWYSLALFHAPGNFAGNPSWTLPERAVMLWFFVQEPNPEDPGYMILLLYDENMRTRNKTKIVDLADPKKVFKYDNKTGMRLHIMPYDRELHRQMEKAKEKKKNNFAIQLIFKKGKGKFKKDTGRMIRDDTKIEIKNLAEDPAMKKPDV